MRIRPCGCASIGSARASPEYQEALVAAGWQVQRHPYAPDALRIEPAADARTLPGFAAGQVSVQDAAAQLAVELLAPQPGERILDACAAPGGKTCHVLERVGGPCHVTALDVSASRLDRVHENLARLRLSADVRAGDLASPAAGGTAGPMTGSCSTCRARRPA